MFGKEVEIAQPGFVTNGVTPSSLVRLFSLLYLARDLFHSPESEGVSKAAQAFKKPLKTSKKQQKFQRSTSTLNFTSLHSTVHCTLLHSAL